MIRSQFDNSQFIDLTRVYKSYNGIVHYIIDQSILLYIKASERDDEGPLQVLRQVRSGCKVDVEAGLRQALQRLNELPVDRDLRPDLIVVQAPSIEPDLLECVSAARKRCCPVVVLTEAHVTETIRELYIAGASSVLFLDGSINETLRSIGWYWLAYNRTPK